jgi:hypothetical protein
MTAERVAAAERWVGCVLHVRTGVFDVLTNAGEVRASLDGAMLGKIAHDRTRMPVPGDWVELCGWPDGRVTVARSLRPRLAQVIELRPR